MSDNNQVYFSTFSSGIELDGPSCLFDLEKRCVELKGKAWVSGGERH